MNIAVTGATGFLGRYIVNRLTGSGHSCRCWFRPESDRGGFDAPDLVEWVPGELSDGGTAEALVDGMDAVVHSALHHPGGGFRQSEGDLLGFIRHNILGTAELIESARRANVARFVFVSTCAVHDEILDDRALDEAHPLWPKSHYGAHKAAIEKFVHSYGLGDGYDICSVRPTGIYGIARPMSRSKWYNLVSAVRSGTPIASARGGKEVHVADVARAVELLLKADGIRGQAYNCYDVYVAEQDVAEIARSIIGSDCRIDLMNKGPRHTIETGKLRALGMEFGGRALLESTVRSLVEAVS